MTTDIEPWAGSTAPGRMPELRASDVCDRSTCSARAFVVTLHAGHPLYWCAHHYALVQEHVGRFTVVDRRHLIDARSSS